MPFSTPNRRDFMRASAIGATATAALTMASTGGSAAATEKAPTTNLRWIDGKVPALQLGQSWGVPWPKGAYKPSQNFRLRDAGGRDVPLQSWPLATWPDGSLKWSAHSIPAGETPAETYELQAGKPAVPDSPVKLVEKADAITISIGSRQWVVPKQGSQLIASASVEGREVLRGLHLVAISQDQPDLSDTGSLTQRNFTSVIGKVTVEQSGPIRAVVKLEGSHRGTGTGADGVRDWLPFTVRLYFQAGAESVRVMHSFIFDGDEHKDFICGLGLRASVPLADAPHDRHIRFAGLDGGLWGEAVRPLTGLRRDPGKDYRAAQIAGQPIPALSGMAETVSKRLELIPSWGDFTLSQPNADGFAITKRTKPGHGWINAQSGQRAAGLGYVGGGTGGGAAFALSHFWESHPSRLDIRGANGDLAEVTIWLWSPDAPAMDLRFYHDGLGMKDHPTEREALEITYEDYEEGWGRPFGIARTSELHFWSLPATPAREKLVRMAAAVRERPQLMCPPERLHAVPVFGDWALVDRSTPTRKLIEDQADFLLDLYQRQVEQRRWYGFWHYGDVMHTYDADRHEWRYDIGGYAWANSELSPDLWLWYSFLRTGRGDVFRLAEAMTRHTGEVDVCHLGPYRGFGTRHGVQHWADSSKQPRISNAAYRRIYYFLSGGDERVGDLMRSLLGSEETLTRVDISRKLGKPPPTEVMVGFGTSWGSFLSMWLAEWERTGEKRWRDRILAGMNAIGKMQRGWFTGEAPFDLASGAFKDPGDQIGVSHLSAVFGAVEINSELLTLVDAPEYRKAWLEYCAFYNAPAVELRNLLGKDVKGRGLTESHSRLTAYAAHHLGDQKLADRAWQEFLVAHAKGGYGLGMKLTHIEGAAVLHPVDENPAVSTNSTAQWGLAAFQNLALIGDRLEAVAAHLGPDAYRTKD